MYTYIQIMCKLYHLQTKSYAKQHVLLSPRAFLTVRAAVTYAWYARIDSNTCFI